LVGDGDDFHGPADGGAQSSGPRVVLQTKPRRVGSVGGSDALRSQAGAAPHVTEIGNAAGFAAVKGPDA
jgi:hypothetical protein